MKIMSLNVNQFQVLKLQEGSWVKEILVLIKVFLYDNPDGVVFLYEIPERFWKTGDLESALVPYEVIYSGRGKIFTVAIKSKDNIWIRPTQDKFSCPAGYENRYTELCHQKSEIRVLGIHAPMNGSYDNDGEVFLGAVEAHAKCIDQLIIVGDFNITTNKWRTKEIEEKLKTTKSQKAIRECKEFYARQKWLLEAMPSIGYSDAVQGDPPTYFWKDGRGTTIDHVLVSESLTKNVRRVKVFAQRELELSDHAAIIVDIQEKIS